MADLDLSPEALAKWAESEADYKRTWLRNPRRHVLGEFRSDAEHLEALAALARAAAAPSPDVAAIEEAAYKRGWNDREDDLIAGVERIVPPEHRQPAALSEAALRALVEQWRDQAHNLASAARHKQYSDRMALEVRAEAKADCAADLAALLVGGAGGEA